MLSTNYVQTIISLEGYKMVHKWIFLKPATDELNKLKQKGKFSFNIHPRFNKTEVKKWIELTLGIQVLAINTYHPIKKQKRRGRNLAYPVRHKTVVVSFDQVKLKAIQPSKSKNSLKKVDKLLTTSDTLQGNQSMTLIQASDIS